MKKRKVKKYLVADRNERIIIVSRAYNWRSCNNCILSLKKRDSSKRKAVCADVWFSCSSGFVVGIEENIEISSIVICKNAYDKEGRGWKLTMCKYEEDVCNLCVLNCNQGFLTCDDFHNCPSKNKYTIVRYETK